jgi:hypothetical protein
LGPGSLLGAHGEGFETTDQIRVNISFYAYLFAALTGCYIITTQVKNLSSSSQVQLIPAAFPALQRLVLSNTALADGSLLRHLQGCSQLTRLRLDCCQVDAGSEGSAAAALAQLPHLVSLTLKGSTPLSLASQLTGLLNLRLTDRQESVHDLFQVAAQCPELCSLTVRSNSTREQAVPAEQLRSLLGSCPSLTCLDMACHSIDQQGLEALLQLGPNITDLTLSSIQATRDLSGRECKWRWLTLDTQEACNVVYLANLPLRGVERLILNSEESVHLGLPVSAVPAPELPGLVRKAALNIASCPAWQKRPSPSLHLFTMATEPGSEPFWWAGLLPEVRIPILQALAPLGGPHMQLFSLSSRADGALAVGGAELRSLSSALGPGLNELLLDDNCGADHSAGILIEFDFWPALRTCFPALQGLLLRDVRGSVTEADLIMCSQASSRPITFSLSAGIMEGALDLDYLKSRLTVWGLTHVTLQQLPF